MNGLPADIDLSFLHGTVLLQLCVGENDLILRLDDDVNVTTTSSVALKDPTGLTLRDSDFGRLASALSALLGRSVISAKGTVDGTLTIDFGGGYQFQVFDDSSHYESYSITHRGGTIVV